MSEEDIRTSLHTAPAVPGGSDAILLGAGIQHGLYASLRKGAFYLQPASSSMEVPGNDWRDVELRYVWCDRSVWEMPWGTWALQAELKDAKITGKPTIRNIRILRLRGANHFVRSASFNDVRLCDVDIFLTGPLGRA